MKYPEKRWVRILIGAFIGLFLSLFFSGIVYSFGLYALPVQAHLQETILIFFRVPLVVFWIPIILFSSYSPGFLEIMITYVVFWMLVGCLMGLVSKDFKNLLKFLKIFLYIYVIAYILILL